MLIGQWNNGTALFEMTRPHISLFGSDGLKYIGRRIGEDMNPDCVTPTVKHPVSVMIWDYMTSRGVDRICDKWKYKCPKTHKRNS